MKKRKKLTKELSKIKIDVSKYITLNTFEDEDGVYRSIIIIDNKLSEDIMKIISDEITIQYKKIIKKIK
jgi:hypothetical protein